MPNPFHLRANIDRLWRRSDEHNPGYIRVKALDAIVRELHAPTPQARLNYRLYLATDPYDVARHKLRDLYDQAEPHTQPSPDSQPSPTQAASVHSTALTLTEQESPDEDEDPL